MFGGRTRLLTVLLVCLAAVPAPATTQPVGTGMRHGDLELLGANMAFAGLAAGVVARLDGRPFWKAALTGAGGGALMFAGKRVAASEFEGWGLVGRQISAAGASVTRNAAAGAGALDTLHFPLGPLRLSWSRDQRRWATVRLDLEDAAWTAYGLATDRYRFDGRRSLRAGAIVFTTDEGIRTRDEGAVTGLAGGGTIFLDERDLVAHPRVHQHELVHVAQIDYLKTAFGTPLERWALGRLGLADASIFRFIELGIGHYPFQGLLSQVLEHEAEALEQR